jgi:hypothetical protein
MNKKVHIKPYYMTLILPAMKGNCSSKYDMMENNADCH